MIRTAPVVVFGLLVGFFAWKPIVADDSPSKTVEGKPWRMHVIDNTSRGADGLDWADIDGDGRDDLTVGWEEGGEIRVYFQPKAEHITEPWPRVTVGKVASPEDAKFIDLDNDGRLDVLSACEGKTRRLFAHYSPPVGEMRNPEAWTTEPLPDAEGRQLWMFARPVNLDDRNGIDFFAGAKGRNVPLGYWLAPKSGREPSEWQFRQLRTIGWIMSIEAVDFDHDGDTDLLASDRKGPNRGVFVLINPGADRLDRPWAERSLGLSDAEPMFLAARRETDPDRWVIAAAVKGGDIRVIEVEDAVSSEPRETVVPLPENTGGGKAVAWADVNADGQIDLTMSCESSGGKHGVLWAERQTDGNWRWRTIAGVTGTKFDVVSMRDLDGDGDLDLITCEERENLGVIWYENPTRSPE